jgi:hypothetical protein
MSVRDKLLSILFLLIAAFGASIVAYSLIRSPIARIRSEQLVLKDLRDAMATENTEAGRLLWNHLGDEATKFKKAVVDTKAAFDRTGSLKILPKLNDAVKADYDAVIDIQSTIGEYTDQLEVQVKELEKAIAAHYGDPNGADMVRLALASNSMDKQRGNSVRGQIDLFLGALDIFTQDMNISIAGLNDQYAMIDVEVQAIDARSSWIAALVVVLFIAASFLLVFLFTNRLASAGRRIATASPRSERGTCGAPLAWPCGTR